MAFLPNDSSIILDAVLTDNGRLRMAQGKFKISKFFLFDDEIDYSNYNKDHPSGSAYFDLAILQTPILEAFTNNTSIGNSKLITISRTNLLYLPILKLNDVNSPSNARHALGSYVVAVDKATEDAFANVNGIMMGETSNGGSQIRIDSGLDTSEISPSFTIDSDLVETQYGIDIDNRLGKIIDVSGQTARVTAIDDDNIASYILNLGTDSTFVAENTDRTTSQRQVIAGPRGSLLQFKILTSIDLNTSTFLFNLLGSTTTMNSNSVYFIDTIVQVSGLTTGYRLSLPIRFVKLV